MAADVLSPYARTVYTLRRAQRAGTVLVMSTPRKLASVTPEDVDGAGRPLLWGYGVGHIAMMASRSVWTVRKDIREGKLDPGSPTAVVAYALNKRGAPGLAQDVLDALAADAESPS